MFAYAVIVGAVALLASPQPLGAVPHEPQVIPAVAWRHAPFVINAPGRLDSGGDRRQPRRVRDIESAVRAYADVEEIEDPTWLAHEVEHYARRAIDCGPDDRQWCVREVRWIAGSAVIFIAAGVQAEVVWPARGNVAVRLAWRRVVATPVGSIVLEAPPADFAQALLQEFPSRLRLRTFGPLLGAEWGAAEEARLWYYAEQVRGALTTIDSETHRRHAQRFIDDNLARISLLRLADGAPDRILNEFTWLYDQPVAGQTHP